MAEDSRALLDHLGIERARGVRLLDGRADRGLPRPSRIPDGSRCGVWGGMGMNLITGLADSEEIIAALRAPHLADVKSRTGRQFRIFADRTGADKEALAACMVTSRDADA